MSGTPTFEGKGYKWFYNDGTHLGEIQVDAGVLADRKIFLALQGDEADAFNDSLAEHRGTLITAHFERYKAWLARRPK